MGMSIGFSGTREGMSGNQRDKFVEWILENIEDIDEFHHGCCVGADANAHQIVRDMCIATNNKVVIHGHPTFGLGHPMRAEKLDLDVVHPTQEPMTRNDAIIAASEIMLFTPKFPETRRSGTWATFRHARKLKKPVVMFSQGTYDNPSGK